MLPQEFIRRKRDGRILADAEIADYVQGVTDGRVTDAQIAAFCMATLLRGMSRGERVALTQAMMRSGRVMDWSGLARPVVDKHSTGGVGDKVSLVLAPAVAALGALVPMISGRGLGHTGGTLDKMESIPGYDACPSADRLAGVVRDVGCAIVGQTNDLAPADRRIYAVRDTTGTVESIDLITASILSKKLAAGLHALVLDVKFGTGAFMRDVSEARQLALTLVDVAVGAGLPTTALLTNMNACLGRTAGNALEVREAVAMLVGDPVESVLAEVTVDLIGEMLVSVNIAPDLEAARLMARQTLSNGRAAETFGRMVAALGGPVDFLDRFDHYLPAAPVVIDVLPATEGYVAAVDARALGLCVVSLGGGRVDPAARVDPSVGLNNVAAPGDAVAPGGRPLAQVHAQTREAADIAVAAVLRAYELTDVPLPARVAVVDRVG